MSNKLLLPPVPNHEGGVMRYGEGRTETAKVKRCVKDAGLVCC